MHGLVQWRTMKYEEKQPWEKWDLITVLAACAQLNQEEAKPHFRRELVAHIPTMNKMFFDRLGVWGKNIDFAMHTFGTVYYNEGRWKEAEQLEVQVMKNRKTVLGEEHPSTLASMANLASTYSNQEQWKEAEELQVYVIEIRKTILGKERPSTLLSVCNLVP